MCMHRLDQTWSVAVKRRTKQLLKAAGMALLLLLSGPLVGFGVWILMVRFDFSEFNALLIAASYTTFHMMAVAIVIVDEKFWDEMS